MRLEEVLPALRAGKKMRRRRWIKGCYIVIVNGVIADYDTHDDDYSYLDYHDTDDFLAEDWEVVE